MEVVADIGLSRSELLHGATAASLTVSSVLFGTLCALKYLESYLTHQGLESRIASKAVEAGVCLDVPRKLEAPGPYCPVEIGKCLVFLAEPDIDRRHRVG